MNKILRMKTLPILIPALGLAAALALGGASAAAEEANYAPIAGAPRIALIPARSRWVERQVQVPPVTETREVPVYETVKVPVYGTLTTPEVRTVEVPRYAEQKKPVKITLWNPFECFEEFDVKLWDRTKCVQVGTELRQETVQRTEQVVVGDREERRCVGYRTETVVVAPARTETVRECIEVPERWVTLAPQGTALLAGTTEVMSEEQYRREIASVR